jgi:hypothetical protein
MSELKNTESISLGNWIDSVKDFISKFYLVLSFASLSYKSSNSTVYQSVSTRDAYIQYITSALNQLL